MVIITFSEGNAFLARYRKHWGGGIKRFEAIKFNTDHSLTPNIFKSDVDRRCNAPLLDLAARYRAQVTAKP